VNERGPDRHCKASEIAKLHAEGVSKSKIASTLGIGRTSVRRILSQAPVGASSLKDRNSDPQVGLIIFKP